MGTLRHTVIAESDAGALEVARRAYLRWRANFWSLFLKFNIRPRFAPYPETFDELMAAGQAIAGSPATVREALQRQIDATGVNYLILDPAFGDLTLAESMRTVELFARDVMPALRETSSA
jgi:alkanesulfonate monooxygenase SsuD/methylene tetrahydromethanopterin reductase-like flavin-dependent oxidoreductase (luciferase family)